jgi:hypothetical protein
MAAGMMRAHVRMSAQSPYGVYTLPVDYAASMDELIPPVTIEVADGTTDQALIILGAAGLTTIQGLMIVSTVAITVKLGAAGANVALALAANAPLVLMGTSLTAVSISNASGEVALVTYSVGGT